MIHRLTNLFALWTVLGTAWAWFIPAHFLWVVDGRFQPFGQSLVSVMLGLVMLGMGLSYHSTIAIALRKFRNLLAQG